MNHRFPGIRIHLGFFGPPQRGERIAVIKHRLDETAVDSLATSQDQEATVYPVIVDRSASRTA